LLLLNSLAPSAVNCQELPVKPLADFKVSEPAKIITANEKPKLPSPNLAITGGDKPNYVPGEVLVMFKTGTASVNSASLNRTLGAIKVKNLGRTGVQQLKIRPGLSVEKSITEYQNQPEVEFAQPNYIYHLEATTPNDPGYSSLWGLHNTGQSVNGTTGAADADIDAPEAWDITTGSSSVIVAVLDSGVDYNHPDISGNIWRNAREIASNGTDDDGNGYIDDIRGWDFVDNDNAPMDSNQHGTHVAGTIGAIGNNGIGITGVAWTTKIMPVRVMDSLGSGTTADIASGIDYAVANGARIINMSVGGAPGDATDPAIMAAIGDANSAGVLLVVAAGNDTNNNDAAGKHVYPSDYTNANIVSVAATTQNDALASFSNYGAVSVDVGAPGTNIYSLKPARETVYSEGFESGATGWATSKVSGNYWIRSNRTAHGGSYSLDDGSGAANYPANSDSSVLSPNFSLVGKSGCKATVYVKMETETNYDFFSVMASTGGAYTSVDAYSGSTAGSWVPLEFDLKPYEGNATVSLGFRLTSDSSNNFDGVQIDDISVTCSSTTFTGTEYQYLQGTSMATPQVAGLAALLLAQTPALTVTELKAAILANGDPLVALSGRTTSGKRINAYKSALAVDKTPPASPLISINNGVQSTGSSSVTLNLSATDVIGVTGYYVSEAATTPSSGSFTAITATKNYSANVVFNLSSGDGLKTVYAWFKDSRGNISVSASATITLDKTPPADPAISINHGEPSTNSTSVTLTLSATDVIGVTGYYVSESSAPPSAGSFTAITSTTSYSANVSFNLSSGYGTKTVYAWYRDAIGNISAMATGTISYPDPTATAPPPPAGGGGGCSLSRDGSVDPLLSLVCLLAVVVILRRRYS
jgi:subtilisin family serine protease